jgi:hypothetical protein
MTLQCVEAKGSSLLSAATGSELTNRLLLEGEEEDKRAKSSRFLAARGWDCRWKTGQEKHEQKRKESYESSEP